jgi:hypothetical protein
MIIKFACRFPGDIPDVRVILLPRARRRADKAAFLPAGFMSDSAIAREGKRSWYRLSSREVYRMNLSKCEAI